MVKDKIFKEDYFENSPFGPSDNPGVYAICAFELNKKVPIILYIGSSLNIRKRLSGTKHIYRRLHSILKSYIVSALYIECDNYLEVEKELIRKYTPRFNKIIY